MSGLQQRYRTAYHGSNNILSSIFSPGLHKTLKPLFTEYPTKETAVNPYFKAAMDGFSTGLHAGLWSEAVKGISTRGVGSKTVYSANGDPALRATRRPAFDGMKNSGVEANGTNYKMNEHAYNSMFKSGRKDIMPADISDALKAKPVPAKAGSVCFTNPATGTQVFVNTSTNEIVGIWPVNFVQ